MVVLGLLPPYAMADVKQAHRDKARLAHPDQGGSVGEFRRVQEAYEQAQEFLALQTDRRSWIAGQMDRYVAQQEVEERLRGFGALVEIRRTDWVQEIYGDFAELTATIVEIQLVDAPVGNAVVELMVAHRLALTGLKVLRLVGCGLSNEHAMKLSAFPLLTMLDLGRNPIDHRIAELAESLPDLRDMRVEGTSVGWWGRRRILRALRKHSKEAGVRLNLGKD